MMSWHPQYRSSKFRHVFGKPASKENCYDSVPITRSVHDNHFCAVNPHFIAVVTECAGGGAFLVIPLHQQKESLHELLSGELVRGRLEVSFATCSLGNQGLYLGNKGSRGRLGRGQDCAPKPGAQPAAESLREGVKKVDFAVRSSVEGLCDDDDNHDGRTASERKLPVLALLSSETLSNSEPQLCTCKRGILVLHPEITVQKLGHGPGPESRDKVPESYQCATAKDPVLLMAFDPGNGPRERKGCVQEGGQGTDSQSTGTLLEDRVQDALKAEQEWLREHSGGWLKNQGLDGGCKLHWQVQGLGPGPCGPVLPGPCNVMWTMSGSVTLVQGSVIELTGKLDPHYPKVCGHRGNVLDVKWNPFDDFEIASCSEDATVSVSPRAFPFLKGGIGLAGWTVPVLGSDASDSIAEEASCKRLETVRTINQGPENLAGPTRKVRSAPSQARLIKIWSIPNQLLTRNLTTCKKELVCHVRRVGLVEWHPTAANILFSAGYDYKVMIWNLDTKESVITSPVRTITCHQDVILSMSFNTNGSLLATTCKDRKIRVIDPRAGTVLREASYKGHRASKVLFLGNLKKLMSTGTSRWNNRQVALWDQDDLSVPLMEEDLDGSSGVLFPFYDADTSMLYLVGKGDGNIRYYEVSTNKPHLSYLTEYRSYNPQKGIGE
ncbi:hypothetical protein P7K49_001424 [Saguinus oedipus]|uniref:Coronin n=1 Tax=Saguinus oedipus TaxID=9490 RepID=A0ABQ9WGX3_SAGOE|nr:hypothetical protein P7K49_001424 [Saguinus oedipus]